MRIVNRHNLDPAIVKAIKKSMAGYSNGGADYSVTTLLNPPRIVHLSRRHWDEIEVDAADLAWAFWGNLGHLALQHAADGDAEKRLMIEVEGRKISGQVDHYRTEVIHDYKFTKVWSLRYPDKILDWAFQLNTYAKIFRWHSYSVRECKIHAFLKDWDEYKAKREPGYPQIFIQTVPILLWSEDKTDAAVADKVKLLKSHEDTPDDGLPECTEKEKWEKGKSWAVKKKGSKRAVSGGVFDNKKEAEAYRDYLEDSSLIVEERHGTRTRCDRYCLVKDFCSVHQTERKAA